MDYGVGDWVVCVSKKDPMSPFVLGGKYCVRELKYTHAPSWGVKFHGVPDAGLGTTGYWHAYAFRKFDPKTNEDDAATIAEKALSDIRARMVEVENARRWAIFASPGLGQPWGQS